MTENKIWQQRGDILADMLTVARMLQDLEDWPITELELKFHNLFEQLKENYEYGND